MFPDQIWPLIDKKQTKDKPLYIEPSHFVAQVDHNVLQLNKSLELMCIFQFKRYSLWRRKFISLDLMLILQKL